MPSIVQVNHKSIILEGIDMFDKPLVEEILKICHRYKHLYLEGYKAGRKTRKAEGDMTEKWADCPEICITYTLMPCTEIFEEENNFTPKGNTSYLEIRNFVSEEEKLSLTRMTADEIIYWRNRFTNDIADDIEKLFLEP